MTVLIDMLLMHTNEMYANTHLHNALMHSYSFLEKESSCVCGRHLYYVSTCVCGARDNKQREHRVLVETV